MHPGICKYYKTEDIQSCSIQDYICSHLSESKYRNEAGNICLSVIGHATSQTALIKNGFEEDFTFLSLTDQYIRRKIKGMGKKPKVVSFSKGYC